MADEKIRLELDYTQATQSTKALEKETYDLADAYEVLDVHVKEDTKATETFAEAQARLRQQLKTTEAALAQAAVETRNLGVHFATAQREATNLRGTSGYAGTGLLSASYAAQDFTSVLSGGGGLGRALNSVSNNIPQILLALGAGGGLAGILGAVTAVAAAGIDPLLKYFGIAEDRSKDLKEALDSTAKALENLSGKQKLTNEQMAEYNKLLETQKDLEKESADRKLAASAREEKEAAITGRQKERGEMLTELLSGRGMRAGAIEAIERQLQAPIMEEIRELEMQRAIGRVPMLGYQRRRDELQAQLLGVRGQAETALGRAETGAAGAMREAAGMMPEGVLADIFGIAGPEGQAARRESERGALEQEKAAKRRHEQFVKAADTRQRVAHDNAANVERKRAEAEAQSKQTAALQAELERDQKHRRDKEWAAFRKAGPSDERLREVDKSLKERYAMANVAKAERAFQGGDEAGLAQAVGALGRLQKQGMHMQLPQLLQEMIATQARMIGDQGALFQSLKMQAKSNRGAQHKNRTQQTNGIGNG